MDHLSLHILRPNKSKSRYFGVDYFLSMATGHQLQFHYLSTPLDPNPIFKTGPISLHPDMFHFLDQELSTKEKGSIIGIFANPDIYDAIDSISSILTLLEKYEMGLFLETNSSNILNDIPALVAFQKKQPLLIGITVSMQTEDSKLIKTSSEVDQTIKIMQKLRQNSLRAGFIAKPFIPFINDDVLSFQTFLDKAVDSNAVFVYPTFQINFDSRKIKAFYDTIDLEYPELMIKMRDAYGFKTSWESPNASELKKRFIIICRKNKILYAMKDIINSYKPDINVQLKLF